MGHSVETSLTRRLRGLAASLVIGTGAVFYFALFTPAPEAAETVIVSALIAEVGAR
jgi:hypothetical protein